MGAHTAPTKLAIGLPDLKSRLLGCPIYQLPRLGDDELCQALTLRAASRGLSMTEEVSVYMVNHLRRDMSALCALLEHLDKASLQHKRKLTIPFVRQVLAGHQMLGGNATQATSLDARGD